MDNSKKGIFLTVEGPDGSGKTTQVKLLVTLLKEKGYDVVQTREPGGSPIAEKLRALVLGEVMTPMAELLVFAAARAEHMARTIMPALEEGKIVVSDRFSDSSYAYQGMGRGYEAEVLQLETMVQKGFQPKYTLFFDMSLVESNKRLAARSEETNHLDGESEAFKRRVYRGYLKRYVNNKDRMIYINASGEVDMVALRVANWINNHFIPSHPPQHS